MIILAKSGSVCFTLYVPGVNDTVFHQGQPGRWGWLFGIVACALFVSCSELYKAIFYGLISRAFAVEKKEDYEMTTSDRRWRRNRLKKKVKGFVEQRSMRMKAFKSGDSSAPPEVPQTTV